MRFKFLLPVILSVIIAIPSISQGKSKIRWNKLVEDDLLKFLTSNNMEYALKAVEELGKRKSPSSLDELLGQLLLGHPPELSLTIINAIGSKGNVKSFKTLSYFASHRNHSIRSAALTALSLIQTGKDQLLKTKIDNILIRALRDFDSNVRNTAAFLIGKRKIASAEKDLLVLFGAGSIAAVDALGYIGGITTARTFAIALDNKKVSKERIISSILTMLKRNDFGPEPVRVQLVKILGSLNLPGAQDALIKYHGTGPEKFMRSRKLAFKILSK
ncbi:MAG: hypothetical protein JXR95_13505 [Deltaproteobacteria bacterium]|nr:hypothetical protein [Deltaproteobacteria bacterium]